MDKLLKIMDTEYSRYRRFLKFVLLSCGSTTCNLKIHKNEYSGLRNARLKSIIGALMNIELSKR